MAEASIPPGVRGARDDRLAGWIIAACVAYAALFAVLRLGTLRVILFDDTLEALHGQSWALAYVSTQPPLYTWIVRAAVLGFGDAPLAHLTVKYVCFAIAAACIFNAARATLADVRLAAFAAGSLLMVWDIGVEAHRQLTQTILLFAFVAGTWHIVVRVLHDGVTAGRAVALGLSAAGGALTKYSYIFYAATLALVVAADPSSRRRFADRRLWLALLVAALLVAPHVLAMQSLARVSASMFTGEASGPLARRLTALWQFVRMLAVASLPMPLIWAAFFPAAFRRAPAGTPPPGLAETLLGRWCIVALGLGLFGAVAFGTFRLRAHYIQPLLIPVAILFFARIARLAPAADSLRRFGWAVLAAPVAGAIGVFAWLVIEGRQCANCQPLRDYRAAARALADAGARDAFIIGADFQAVGNLIALLPDARGWALQREPPEAIPADAIGRSCTLVWGNRVGEAPWPIPDWARALVRTPPGPGEVRDIPLPIRRLLGGAPRVYWMSFTVVPAEACLLPARGAAR